MVWKSGVLCLKSIARLQSLRICIARSNKFKTYFIWLIVKEFFSSTASQYSCSSNIYPLSEIFTTSDTKARLKDYSEDSAACMIS